MPRCRRLGNRLAFLTHALDVKRQRLGCHDRRLLHGRTVAGAAWQVGEYHTESVRVGIAIVLDDQGGVVPHAHGSALLQLQTALPLDGSKRARRYPSL
jgi:hypothetical protein